MRPSAWRAGARLLPLVTCFFFSGAAALVYETAWTEEFVLVFGASELAVVCVLAAYMGGSAAGAAAAGRWLSHVRRPLLVYGMLELLIAAGALAVPALIASAAGLQAALLGRLPALADAGGPGTVAFHLACSFVLLLPPTAAMGATLPLLARHAVVSEDTLGPHIGLLYAVNALGAAVGTLATAFVLLPHLGLGRSVLIGVAANLIAFVVAGTTFLATRRAAEPAAEPPPTPAQATGPRFILPLIATSGAASFAGEVLWTRLLTHVLGSSVYAFGTMLASYLLGIALGAGVGSRLARRAAPAREAFALAQVATAVLSVAALLLIEGQVAGAVPAAGALLGSVTACALTILPTALAIGATVPLAVRVRAGGVDSAGRATAEVLAWNTLGCVVGAAAGGLWLLPWLRFARALACLAAIGLLLAAACWLAGRPRRPWPATVAALLAIGVLLRPPATPWSILRSSALAPEPGARSTDPVAFYAVGRSATVLATDEGAEWRLTTNGLPEAAIQRPGSRPSRYAIARLLGLLPVAARPEASSMLVVGLGGGATVEDVPASVREIVVVELEPEVVSANRALRPRRRDPLSDPRLHLISNDARSALQLSARRFDAIVSQPSHPWTSGASHLFTREFFTLAREHLTPEGVLVQWIGLHFVDELLARSLLATLTAVFPQVEVYQPYPGGALLFLSSRTALDLERTGPSALAQAPEAWALAGVHGPVDLTAARLLDAAGSRALAEGAPLITDHANLLQTRSPRILSRPLVGAALDRLFAPYDSARRPPAGRAGLALVRRLLEQREDQRALRAATSLADASARDCAYGLVDLSRGRVERGRGMLLEILRRRPAHAAARWELGGGEVDEEAGYGLLLSLGGGGGGAPLPRGLAEWTASEPLASALWEGWRLVREQRGRELADLEDLLALAPPGHPAFRAATRLRISWRSATGEAARAREALELLDGLLATGASVADLLLRARLGVAGGDLDAVLASLHEVAPAVPRQTETALQVRAILESLPPAQRRDARVADLEARLAVRAEGSR